MLEQNSIDRIVRDQNFKDLVRERTGFAWTMSGIMLVVYLAFIFMVAFGKAAMSSTIGGSSISWGIILGLAVIVFAFVLTGVYVARANSRFDELTSRLHEN